MSSANVAAARRGYEALLRGDYDAISELLAEDVKWHGGDPDAELACHNRGQALAFMRRTGRRGPGRLVDVIDAGERVVVITQPPSTDGSEGSLHAQITTFRDGKIVEMVGYETPEAALAAAGVDARPESLS